MNIFSMPEEQLIGILQSWLTDHIPNAKNVVVKNVRLPQNGASNITALIDVAWLDNGNVRDEKLVLRTVAPDTGQLYETYDLTRQYRVMQLLAQTEIKVPRLLAFENNKALLGNEFYVMFNTGGCAVLENPPYHVSGWFAELTAEQRRKIWMEAIDTIAAVHRLDWQALGFNFLTDNAQPQIINERFIKRHSDLLYWMERRNGHSYPRLRRVFDWLEANFPHATPAGLLWADAKLGNLMIEGDEIVGVLDWEHCTLGPSLYDLANFMIFDLLLSVGSGIPRLSGLPDAAETIARYEAATGRSAADIQYFKLFSAVRLANVVCGMAPGLIAAGYVPADFEERNSGIAVLNMQLEAMGLAL